MRSATTPTRHAAGHVGSARDPERGARGAAAAGRRGLLVRRAVRWVARGLHRLVPPASKAWARSAGQRRGGRRGRSRFGGRAGIGAPCLLHPAANRLPEQRVSCGKLWSFRSAGKRPRRRAPRDASAAFGCRGALRPSQRAAHGPSRVQRFHGATGPMGRPHGAPRARCGEPLRGPEPHCSRGQVRSLQRALRRGPATYAGTSETLILQAISRRPRMPAETSSLPGARLRVA